MPCIRSSHRHLFLECVGTLRVSPHACIDTFHAKVKTALPGFDYCCRKTGRGRGGGHSCISHEFQASLFYLLHCGYRQASASTHATICLPHASTAVSVRGVSPSPDPLPPGQASATTVVLSVTAVVVLTCIHRVCTQLRWEEEDQAFALCNGRHPSFPIVRQSPG